MEINICLACDDNYTKYAGVVIASILANANAADELHFFILDGNISKESKEKINQLKKIKDCRIDFVAVNEADFEDYKSINNHDYITIATYYRLKLAALLPQISKIIYLDCDVIVNSSLEELFKIPLGENILGGVTDIDVKIRNYCNYINAGVLLIDLDNVRKYSIEQQYLDYTKANHKNIQLGDQGVINDVLKGRIKILDNTYNLQSECFIRRSSFIKNPVIVHYIGSKKPWHFGSWSYHKQLYFKYLQLTPWKLSQKELFYWTVLNKTASFISWYKHRPFFFLQKKFWKAAIMTFIYKGE